MLTFQFDLLSKPIDPIQGSFYELGAKIITFFILSKNKSLEINSNY